MSQPHVHSSFHQIPPTVLAFIKQQALVAERPNATQLDAIAAQLQKNVEYQEAVKNGTMPHLGVKELDFIVKKVHQSRFGTDSGENKGDREAKRAQRNENGYLDWVVLQVSDEFDTQREAVRQNGVGMATLDEVLVECGGAEGIFRLRLAHSPSIEAVLDTVRERVRQMNAAA